MAGEIDVGETPVEYRLVVSTGKLLVRAKIWLKFFCQILAE